MACEDARMKQEDQLVRFMEYTKFYWEVSNGDLVLSLLDGSVVAMFIEIPYVREGDDPSMMGVSSTTTTVFPTTTMAVFTSAVSDEFSLIGTEWQATEIGYKNHSSVELRPALKRHPVTLTFDSEGRIGGNSGCNGYGAEVFDMTNDTFSVGPMMSTMMMCFEVDVMEQEYAYAQLLTDETFFYEIFDGNETELVLLESLTNDNGDEVEGDVVVRFVLVDQVDERRLQVTDHEDVERFVFTDATDITIIGTEWLASEFAVFNSTQSSATIEMQSILDDHTITLGFESATKIYGNAGCNNYFSLQAKLSDSRLDVGGIATTRMLCPGEGVMEQEEKYTYLLSGRSFFYQVIVGSDEDDELVLTEVVSVDGNDTEGQVLARFVRPHLPSNVQLGMSEMVERELGATEVTAKKKGGLFNAYQTTPVHQGYGTHFATMWVGTPPQRKSVIIDTGSHYTAFPCKGCINCGEEHHTDKYFDPDESSTFHALTCTECQSASCLKGKCVFSQSCK
jgi:heat shock protein HslJ